MIFNEKDIYYSMLRWGIAATELAETSFQVGKNELWPIPDAEISSNASVGTED
ncbi:hypothetical protein [Ancylomarina sp. 16SWW S1-10-2]|uniref:hypothetical protein n=1 Tax=Ancylomarina sp. 16SWW S1-10-2 TaxID=2499681 RepID=UPI0012ADD376|nr:hypothetical protein [Ancylomarina sp. 16SWW S1-10-2]